MELQYVGNKPEQMTPGSAGMDLRTEVELQLEPGKVAIVPTGTSIAIPSGYVGYITPRSGLAAKHGVTVLNSPGTIDSDYRGELKIILINHSNDVVLLPKGSRVAQLVIHQTPEVELVEVKSLDDTERGAAGFGSTGS